MESIIKQINDNNKDKPQCGLIYIEIDNLPNIVIPKGYDYQSMTHKLKDAAATFEIKSFSSRSSMRLRNLAFKLPKLKIEPTSSAGKKTCSPKTPKSSDKKKTPEWFKSCKV